MLVDSIRRRHREVNWRPMSPLRRPLPLLLLLSFLLIPPVSAFYSSQRKLQLREDTRALFHHAYGAYKTHAYPEDELKPLSCIGVGVNRTHPNIADNDVFGDFALTLVDTLDMFAILGENESFENAVKEVIETVHFDKDARVQVFEVTIRMLGGLLSGHILATSPKRGFQLPWYRGELLTLANDLGTRLLPAFKTRTGIPYARVHLRHGVRLFEPTETCSAGAGSLLLEFGTLSRLTGNPIFEEKARKAFFAIWNSKSDLGLLGNTLLGHDRKWLLQASSTGAGIDSIFEYAAKSHILFGQEEYWRVWTDMYSAILKYSRAPDGFWYRPVNMHNGQVASLHVDSLSAFFPGLQTLVGELEAAIKAHAVYAFQWKRYHALPEIFDISKRTAIHLAYPLRPEFVESNYYLYLATKDDWYLEMAEQILHDIEQRMKVECGVASLLNVVDGTHEDKMPSFFTSETLKYLFLTFDEHNPFNKDDGAMVFSTEAHMLELIDRPKPRKKRRKTSPSDAPICPAYDPQATDKQQHFLSLSVGRRIDFEHARYLVGYEIEDEQREIREGRWSENGWCEMGTNEEYVVELVFSHSVKDEVLAPGPELVRTVPHPTHHSDDDDDDADDGGRGHDSLVVYRMQGLRFSLTRVAAGTDHFHVTKVGPHRVPLGRTVLIEDPLVLEKMPPLRPEQIQLRVTNFGTMTTTTMMTLPGLASSFGPSLATSTLPFSYLSSSLELVTASFSPFGCTFDSLVSDTPQSQLRGRLLLLHRGECSFIQKASAAYQVGALGVIVIDASPLEDVISPMANEEELARFGGDVVPLVVVSAKSGESLERLLMEREGGVQVGVEPRTGGGAQQEEVKLGEKTPILLGGYQVMNIRLGGGRSQSNAS